MRSMTLYRAIVSLPDHMTEYARRAQERIVFFDLPVGKNAGRHLEQILSAVWGIDTAGWVECGFIYNINSEHELLSEHAFGAADTGDLRLFETGAYGGNVIYADLDDVDLFVPPCVRARLSLALAKLKPAASGEKGGA
jgi:hypothetical protein